MASGAARSFIIRGGRVICPASGIDGPFDVCVKAGRVAWLRERGAGDAAARCGGAGGAGSPGLAEDDPREVFDATGLLVTPGLIDMHAHLYTHATPLGIPVDHYCLGRGVTTAVDAGSAGAATLPGLRKFVAETSRTRVLAFVNISAHGLASAGCSGHGAGGELDHLNAVDVEQCVAAARDNADMVVGVKIRLSCDVADNGRNEAEAYARAIKAATDSGVPLMTHHTFSSVPLGTGKGCPGALRPGDVYTHTYHGYPSTILDPETRKVDEAVHAARERGVLFDLGHGQGSFTWTVAEACAAEGFWPDVISTDIHSGNIEGPCYDLPTTMSKMLALGMPLREVIAASTSKPAQTLGWGDRIGRLDVGREADICAMALEDVDVLLEDCQTQTRRVRQRLRPVAAWRRGEAAEITTPKAWPNVDYYPTLRPEWDKLLVRDAEAP